jgi:hypothetical protein
VRPDISLSSDFIVGFPGETEDDFDKMMKLIDDIGFDASFSFVFSARPGTPAANLPDDTPQASSSQRLQHLQAAIEANVRRISASRVGTVQRILVEGPSRKDASRADGPHRVQPHRQLRRPAGAPGRPDDRRAHHRRPCRIRCAARCWCASAPPCRRRRLRRSRLGSALAGSKPAHHRCQRAGQHHRAVGRHAAITPEDPRPASSVSAAAPRPSPPAGARHTCQLAAPEELGTGGGQQADAERRREEVEQMPQGVEGPRVVRPGGGRCVSVGRRAQVSRSALHTWAG